MINMRYNIYTSPPRVSNYIESFPLFFFSIYFSSSSVFFFFLVEKNLSFNWFCIQLHDFEWIEIKLTTNAIIFFFFYLSVVSFSGSQHDDDEQKKNQDRNDKYCCCCCVAVALYLCNFMYFRFECIPIGKKRIKNINLCLQCTERAGLSLTTRKRHTHGTSWRDWIPENCINFQ